MRRPLIVLLAAAAAMPALAAPSADETAAVAVVQQFFTALGKQDAATMRDIVLPGTVMTAMRPKPDGSAEMRRIPVDASFGQAIDPGLEERMWTPVVSLRGPIATVSAPYEFKKDGKTTHCGIDVFGLVKAEGRWKIASLMWTVEPDACAELKRRAQ